MKHILKCQLCSEYTMHEKCECGGVAVTVKPPKYSPEDKYARLRREAKSKEWIEKGLL
ncbi:MAG: nucleolar RNA-binding Nop10p family protein [Candidatus Woesearchaeota archaeon]